MKVKKLLPFTLLTLITLVGCTAINVQAEGEPTWDLNEVFTNIAKGKNYQRVTDFKFSEKGWTTLNNKENNRFTITDRKITAFIPGSLYMYTEAENGINSGYHTVGDSMVHYQIQDGYTKKDADDAVIINKRVDSTQTTVDKYFPTMATLDLDYLGTVIDFSDCFSWNSEDKCYVTKENVMDNTVATIYDLKGEATALSLSDWLEGFCCSCYEPLKDTYQFKYEKAEIDEVIVDGETQHCISLYAVSDEKYNDLLTDNEEHLISNTFIGKVGSASIKALNNW